MVAVSACGFAGCAAPLDDDAQVGTASQNSGGLEDILGDWYEWMCGGIPGEGGPYYRPPPGGGPIIPEGPPPAPPPIEPPVTPPAGTTCTASSWGSIAGDVCGWAFGAATLILLNPTQCGDAEYHPPPPPPPWQIFPDPTCPTGARLGARQSGVVCYTPTPAATAICSTGIIKCVDGKLRRAGAPPTGWSNRGGDCGCFNPVTGAWW